MAALLFLGLLAVGYGQERPQKAGIGFILGEPTGITAKFWGKSERAFVAGLAYSFSDYFLIYGDYLFHFPLKNRKDDSTFVRELFPYVGIGAEIILSARESGGRGKKLRDSPGNTAGTNIGLGARIPLGVEWIPATDRIGVFLELVPGIGLVPATYGFVEGGIGARYYF